MTNSSKTQFNFISHDASQSIRSLPINYNINDKHLFINELCKNIPSCYAKIEQSVSLINNSIYDFFGFGPLAKYSKSSAAGRKAKIFRFIKYLRIIKPAHIIPRGTWVADDWSSGYFHWFADALTRAELVKDYTDKYPLILPEEFKSIEYISQSLEMLGIPCIYIDKLKRVKVQELLLTSYTAPTGNYNKTLLKNLSKRFREWVRENPVDFININKNTSKKIYVSRANTYRRRIINEVELLPIFKKYGFEVVHPENMSFKKQVRLFSSVSVLAGLHGAGLTNMMFMRTGGIVFEIRRCADTQNNCFFTMASDMDLKYCYLLAQPIDEDLIAGDCHVNPSHLELVLSQLEKHG
jgi:capsular polysaccharide biosynthesis protein